jgi:hypothetical protein
MIIELFDEQIEVEPSSLIGSQFKTLLAGAIFNPYGPTIVACCSVAGESVGFTEPLYFLCIHPFSSHAAQVGTVNYSSPVDSQSLTSLHALFGGSCPNLTFTSGLLSATESHNALRQWIASFDDAEDTWAFMNSHKYDPWERAKAQRTAGLTRAFEARREPSKGSPGLLHNLFKRKTKSDANWLDEFTNFLEDARHQKTEQMCFFQAWEGSIEHSPAGQMMQNLTGGAISMKDMIRQWFIPIMLSCRVSEGFFQGPNT